MEHATGGSRSFLRDKADISYGFHILFEGRVLFIYQHVKDMLMIETSSVISILIALLVSTVIIYIVTKLMGESEGIGRALLAAIVGSAVYFLVYLFIGNGLLAAIVAGFVWLLALKSLYKIGWVKALVIAVLIWIFATIIGYFLPTLSGPL
jgi:hypothetical protein